MKQVIGKSLRLTDPANGFFETRKVGGDQLPAHAFITKTLHDSSMSPFHPKDYESQLQSFMKPP